MGERADEMNRRDQFDVTSIDRNAVMRETEGADVTEGVDETTHIRAGIEQTRADMSETITEIQERLSPDHLKEQVKEQVREQFEEAKATVREATIGKAEKMVRNAGETINEARYTIMDTIRENPIPAAMVGIGLGWLLMNRGSSAPRRYPRYDDQGRYYRGGQGYYYASQRDYGRSPYATGERDYGGGVIEQGQRAVSNTVHRAQETAGNVVSRAQETVSDITDRTQETVGNIVNQAQETAGQIASQAQETVGHIADQAQYQAQRVEDRFQQALYENPLAVGALALALGTAVGFTLPQTRRENELLGEARDNLIDKAQSVAQDTLEKVQRVAGEVMDDVQTTAAERAREHGLTGEGEQQERGA